MIGYGNSMFLGSIMSSGGGVAPVNTVAPAITGTAQEGQTVTCSTGTWTGTPVINYAYQWKRNGSNIGSATNSTYTLVTADVSQSITCTVTATNGSGSANSNSNTITPIAAFTGLLDTYSGAAVGYSLRKLRSAYTGNSIRVRRSSDNAEQDFGFVANVLDTASLLTFCGAGNGFVTTWYDQSGNANNATQSTVARQAQIVSSGAVITDPNTTKISTTWTDDCYVITNGINPNTRYLSMGVLNRTSSGNIITSIGVAATFGGVNGQQPFVWFPAAGNSVRSDMSTAVIHGTDSRTGAFVATSLKDASNVKRIYLNGSQLATTGTEASQAGSNMDRFGQSGATLFMGGRYAEYVYWNSEQSTNRTGIETNANTYWNVY
jgi:hypothetical protein